MYDNTEWPLKSYIYSQSKQSIQAYKPMLELTTTFISGRPETPSVVSDMLGKPCAI